MIRTRRKSTRLPNRLRVLRAEHRVSQWEAALHLGISQTKYWEIENGLRAPSDTERAKLAKLFKVTEAEAFPNSPSEAVA